MVSHRPQSPPNINIGAELNMSITGVLVFTIFEVRKSKFDLENNAIATPMTTIIHAARIRSSPLNSRFREYPMASLNDISVNKVKVAHEPEPKRSSATAQK